MTTAGLKATPDCKVNTFNRCIVLHPATVKTLLMNNVTDKSFYFDFMVERARNRALQ